LKGSIPKLRVNLLKYCKSFSTLKFWNCTTTSPIVFTSDQDDTFGEDLTVDAVGNPMA
jgi:hypothetical protein